MGRPQKNLEPHREWLIKKYKARTPLNELLQTLFDKYNIDISRKTLERRLRDWAIPENQVRTEHSDALRNRLEHFYYEYGYNDTKLHQHLTREGFTISLWGVEQLRRNLDIHRRFEPSVVSERQGLLRTYLTEEKSTQSVVRRLGGTIMQTHVRRQRFNLPRDAVREVYKEIHPNEANRRKQKFHRRRGGWTTPGPNYIMSIDAHCKLAEYGFEIYAAIDAFSRFITWCFVGFSALTAQSVFAQYMYYVKRTGFIPQVIRSDHGVETGLMAGAHYYLSAGVKQERFPPNFTPYRGPDDPVQYTFEGNIPSKSPPNGSFDKPLDWRACWSYGTSTMNQRIESWWLRVSEGRSLFWRVSLVQACTGLYGPYLTL